MPWTALRRTAIAVAALAAAYAGYWYYGATVVRGGVDTWIAAARAGGLEAAHEGLAVSGFPLAYHVTIARPAITGVQEGAQWDWRSQNASANLEPFDFQTVRISVNGHQALNVAGGDGRRMRLRSPGPTLVNVVVGADNTPERLDVAARALDIDGAPELAGLSVDRATLAARRRLADPGAGRSEGTDVAFDLAGVALPHAIIALLGPKVAVVRGDLDVIERIPNAPPRAAVTAWRNKGGQLGVRSFLLRWGPLDVNASGTLALDEELQPAGTLDVVVKGYGELLQSIVERGFLGAKDAAQLKALLDLMAKPSAADGRASISAPVTLRRGRVMVGPLALMKLPRIDWPQ